jgi:hypothetical protein
MNRMMTHGPISNENYNLEEAKAPKSSLQVSHLGLPTQDGLSIDKKHAHLHQHDEFKKSYT